MTMSMMPFLSHVRTAALTDRSVLVQRVHWGWLLLLVIVTPVAMVISGGWRWDIAFAGGLGLLPVLTCVLLNGQETRDWAQGLIILAWTMLACLWTLGAGTLASPAVLTFCMAPGVMAVLAGRRQAFEAAVLGTLAIALCALVLRQFDGAPLIADSFPAEAVFGATALVFLGVCLAHARPDKVVVSAPAVKAGARPDTWVTHIPAQILHVDRDGLILSETGERRFLNFQGIRPEDRVLFRQLPDGDAPRVLEAIRAVNRTGEYISLETTIHGETDLSLVFAAGEHHTAQVVVHDITPLKAEAERYRSAMETAADQAAHKAAFLAGMSHELRTPLNAIIGFSDMIRSRVYGPIPEKYAEYADLIHDSGQHLLDLVGDLLDLSKIEAERYDLDLSEFDVRDVVNISVKMLTAQAETGQVSLSPRLPSEALLIRADRRALRQILLNLLSNAVKFTRANGQVIISARRDKQDLILTIADDGVGMTPDDLKRIGQPYAQGSSARKTDARGTGLGLSLVKALTELHEGTFSVASELGRGTTVTVRLPVIAPQPERADIRTLQKRVDTARKR